MTTPTVPTAQVLLIDDDVDMRDVVQIILEDAGYRVTVAAHGPPRSTCCGKPRACRI